LRSFEKRERTVQLRVERAPVARVFHVEHVVAAGERN